MTPNRKINPDRLRALLDKCPLSQKELAAKIGADVGTLSRWKTGKIRKIRSDKLASLCDALGATPTALCDDGPLPETAADNARRDQVTIMLDTACRNALALIARRYGVTRQQIVEVAPLLFAIMAEQCLAERRRKLNEYSNAAPWHLRRSLRGPFDFDDQEVLDAEKRSIDKRDLFAARVGGWDEGHHKDNPFARFLSERLSETGLPKGKAVTWEEGEAPHYEIGIEELDELLGEDKYACFLVLSGNVALAEMPGDTRKATPDARAMWVKEKAVLNERERAYLEELDLRKTFSELGPNLLAAAMRKAREDAEHDF